MAKHWQEAAICLGLFDDMAKAYYGVYENESKYDQYGISVLFFISDTTILLSTERDIKYSVEKQETLEVFFGDYFDSAIEYLQRSKLEIEPIIYTISQQCSLKNKQDVWSFWGSVYQNKMMDSDKLFEFHTRDYQMNAFVYIHINTFIRVPEIIQQISQNIHQTWKNYFMYSNSYEYIPICMISHIIEQYCSDKYFPEIKRFFPVITEISSKYYEKKRCSGKIIITDDKDKDNVQIALNDFKFKCTEARMLRKLLEMTRGDSALLVDRHEELYGIGRYENVKKANTKIIFRILNHLDWEMYDENDKPVLKFKYGKFYLPSRADIEDSYIPRKTGNMPLKAKNLVKMIINNLSNEGHGALVIVMDKAKEEVDRLCRFRCGVAIAPKKLFDEDGCDKDKILSALTSVDGAVFLDDDGVCYGFGMILDGDTFITGSPDRGSRLNSAKRYIARKKKDEINANAVIVSDDGYMNIISGYDMEVNKDAPVYEK